MHLSFRCESVGCVGAVVIVLLAVLALLSPAAYGVWYLVSQGLI